MKITMIILSLINGGYMLADGIYVLLHGKYIGPEKPGPWAMLFEMFNMNVFRLGPMFILFGILWLGFIPAVLTQTSWSNMYGIVLSIATLWYLPFGTIISIAILVMLLFVK